MNFIEINLGNFSSTGNIIKGIQKQARNKGIECYLAFPNNNTNTEICDDDLLLGKHIFRRINAYGEIIIGFNGCLSVFATVRLLMKLQQMHPVILHLHNLHGSYINLPLLFRYIKKNKIPVVWTLHDCWAFTGHCPHFSITNCDRWKGGCHNCPSFRDYPKSLMDNSKVMWKLKKKWFTGVSDMTIVTPSKWLADLVDESFLKEYPVRVINNGIDLSIFKPTVSDLKEKYGIGDKHIVLGVAFGWNYKKGLDVFVDLAERLDSDKYQIILIGTDGNTDKQLPDNIISIHRTHDQKELAKIYSAADVFVNPTREENYPTVNMESLSCGTPVLTFRTGGSPEIIDASCGSVVEKDDVDAMEKEIIRICETKPYSREACIENAKHFDKNARFQEYIDLYKEITR